MNYITGAILAGTSNFLLLLSGICFLIGVKDLPSRIWSVGFFFAQIAYHSQPFLPNEWIFPAKIISATSPALLFMFAKILFEDDHQFSFFEKILTTSIALMGASLPIIDRFYGGTQYLSVNSIIALITSSLVLFMAYTVYIIVKDWQSDLVELRMQLRAFIVTITGVTTALVLVLGGFQEENRTFESIFNSLISAVTIFTASFVTALLAAKSIRELIPSKNDSKPLINTQDEQEKSVQQKIMKAMQKDQLYLDQLLNLQTLSDHIGEPSYKLRTLINQKMGYRNFNTFVNSYRIEAAKQMLANSDYDDQKILAIALDVGYSSLSPFNRAFKSATDMTPSEYRQHIKDNSSQTA